MTEHLFCWCGHPISVEDVPTIEGERQIFSDGKTGAIIEECPRCGDWGLEVRRLFRTESQQGHRTAKPRLGGN